MNNRNTAIAILKMMAKEGEVDIVPFLKECGVDKFTAQLIWLANGYDVDLAELVFKELGITPPTTFDEYGDQGNWLVEIANEFQFDPSSNHQTFTIGEWFFPIQVEVVDTKALEVITSPERLPKGVAMRLVGVNIVAGEKK